MAAVVNTPEELKYVPVDARLNDGVGPTTAVKDFILPKSRSRTGRYCIPTIIAILKPPLHN
jgi:hypothetical protein